MKKGIVTKQTHLFSATSKETPKDAEVKSHQLMLRAGLMNQLAAGVYQYLPLGYTVLKQIEEVIREEMMEIGTQEVLLPTMQPIELWEQTGRVENYGSELMKMKDRHERSFALGPTHEEVITNLANQLIPSYKHLPVSVFQIQTKFRDEKRPRYGLLRGREFVMKDAYSFHESWESLDNTYQQMMSAYKRIMERLDLDYRVVEADGGAIGGEGETHEFMILSDIGEDTIAVCTNCDFAANTEVLEEGTTTCPQCQKESIEYKKGIEVGHIFKLGKKYSTSMEASYLNKEQKQEAFIMGCYGIGVSRLLAAFVETHHDEKGIVWTKEIAPYDVHLLTVHWKDERQKQTAENLAELLKNEGYRVLYDDRQKNAGIKFKDADLMGIPLQIVVGKENMDIKERFTDITNKNQTIETIKESIMSFYTKA